MRGKSVGRLRRRATRKWIAALGRGVDGAGDDWMRSRRLVSTARDTRDEEFRDAGMPALPFLRLATSLARTCTSKYYCSMLQPVLPLLDILLFDVSHSRAANEQHTSFPQR